VFLAVRQDHQGRIMNVSPAQILYNSATLTIYTACSFQRRRL